MAYNSTCKRITSENLAGQVTTTAWDQFACTPVGELVSAANNAKSAKHACDFDDIGNRETSSERGTNSVYAANQLNQYTAVDDFIPQFDDDGNQTLIKTATGVWSVTYNGENRPILWTCTQSNNQTITNNQTISMSFDRMGRRVTKNGQRFVYDGYLQIANFEHQTSNFKLQTFVWDSTEPIATRPLVWWQCEGATTLNFEPSTLNFYTHDGNKNVSEVLASDGTLAAHYECAPFGALTDQRGTSAASNPWRFSAEYAEDTLGLEYFNYRHFNYKAGKWCSRDLAGEEESYNLYSFIGNEVLAFVDALGLSRLDKCEFIIFADHYSEVNSMIDKEVQKYDKEQKPENKWYGAVCCFRDKAEKDIKKKLDNKEIPGMPNVDGPVFFYEEAAKEEDKDYAGAAMRKALDAAISAAEAFCLSGKCCDEIYIRFACGKSMKAVDDENFQRENTREWRRTHPGVPVRRWCNETKKVNCSKVRADAERRAKAEQREIKSNKQDRK